MNSRADDVLDALVTDTGGSWNASLALRFAMRESEARRCALLRARHHGPLYVQKPFYPEGEELAHVYLLHPPGGLVSGDCLELDLELGESCSVLCTTPGAGRLYRARSDARLQRQYNHLRVGRGARLEWLPQETLVHGGARGQLETRVELAAGACFMGWEIVALGLRASGIPFDSGEFRQRFILFREGVPVFVERMVVNGEDKAFMSGAAALAGRATTGCFVAGPCAAGTALEEALQRLRELHVDAPALSGVTLAGDFAVLRYLGDCSAEARRYFVQAWEILRPLLLGRPSCRPRIWST